MLQKTSPNRSFFYKNKNAMALETLLDQKTKMPLPNIAVSGVCRGNL